MKKQRNCQKAIMGTISFYLIICFLLINAYLSSAQKIDKELIFFLKERNQFSDSLNKSTDLLLFEGTYFVLLEKQFFISNIKINLCSFGSNASHTQNYAYLTFSKAKSKKVKRVFFEINKLSKDIEKLEGIFSELSEIERLKIYKIVIPLLLKLYERNM